MIRGAVVAPAQTRELSATEVAARVSAGRLDPASLVRACMEEIEASYDLSAVLARDYAAAIRRARSGVSGPLAGVPLLVSDTLDTAGLTTTLGSAIHRDRIPDRSAAAVVALERAGAIVIGKANVDEFGCGVTGRNPHWGHVANPRRPDHVSGGACGGAAAALAAGVCALALGTDADGGLRIPAACCGTVAFKPAPGRVGARGALSLAPSFDAIGPMARTVRDCATAYSVLAGGPPAVARIEGLRVGVAAATPAAERLRTLGARIEQVELPAPAAPLLPALQFERAMSMRGTYPEHSEELGSATVARLEAARAIAAVDAWEARRALADWRRRCVTEPAVDLLVAPTLGAAIPSRDDDDPAVDAPDGALSAQTLPASLLGWPALAIGDLQLFGRAARVVLGAGLAYEAAFGGSS